MSANNSNSKQCNKADQSNNVKESENSLVNNVLKYDKLGGWFLFNKKKINIENFKV